MVHLDDLTIEEKNLIGQIVDGYLLSYKKMEEDSNSIYNSPGLFLFSLFYNYDELRNPCHITLSNRNGELAASFFIKDCPDNNYFFQQINLRKADFISRATFIETLFKYNLIFFEEDEECGMPKYEEPTKDKHQKLQKEGFSYHTEVIKSESIYCFINKYYWSHIIPSPNLILYRKQKYKTPEQRRHKINVIISGSGIVTAILIALVSPWLMTKCSHTAIEQRQVDSIINAIHSEKDEVNSNLEQLDSMINTIRNFNDIYGKAKNEKP